MRPVDASSTSQVHVPRDAAGDVEAAALTLGAVTVGGLVMRAILASRRDEEKEREKLAAECARLEQEELERARRLERKAMERVDGSEGLPEDGALHSSLLKRLKDMKGDGEDAQSGKDDGGILIDDPKDKKNKYMRQSPIPERGTGSMLLDRPGKDSGESGSGQGGESGADANANTPTGGAQPNADELDMLKRMWNLSSPDDERKP